MSTGIAIPEGARGKIGQLVTLRRVRGLDAGRLAVVRHPVGWVKDLLGAERPVFAWQVMLTGEPVEVHGQMTRELVVADACLSPVCQLSSQQSDALATQQQQADVDGAVQELRSALSDEEMASPAFDRMLHQALNAALLRHTLETVGVAAVLKEAGFWLSNPPDGESLEWHSVFEGQEVRFDAAPGMFGDWTVCAHLVTERNVQCGEAKVLDEWPRGKVLQVLLQLWEGVFGKHRVPRPFEFGWHYRRHQRQMQLLDPGLPFVDVDGDQWRRALRWLREAYAPGAELEGPPVDVPLTLEIRDAMLRLRSENEDIGVRMLRGWIDPCTVSLRRFMNMTPAGQRGPVLRIERVGQGVSLRGQLCPNWGAYEAQGAGG